LGKGLGLYNKTIKTRDSGSEVQIYQHSTKLFLGDERSTHLQN